MMTLVEVLVSRDGLSLQEAKAMARDARADIVEFIETGDLMAAEDYMMEEFGLEPDYMEEFIYG